MSFILIFNFVITLNFTILFYFLFLNLKSNNHIIKSIIRFSKNIFISICFLFCNIM